MYKLHKHTFTKCVQYSKFLNYTMSKLHKHTTSKCVSSKSIKLQNFYAAQTYIYKMCKFQNHIITKCRRCTTYNYKMCKFQNQIITKCQTAANKMSTHDMKIH